MKSGLIYLITNTTNGKRYVGKTTEKLSRRWGGHLCYSRNGSKFALHSAIRKYGPDAFTHEVIAESPEPFLGTLETFFIRLYASHVDHHGYNMTEESINGGLFKGHHHSEATKQRFREHIAGDRNPMFGVVLSSVQKAQLVAHLNRDKYQCPHCPLQIVKGNLSRHIRARHPQA